MGRVVREREMKFASVMFFIAISLGAFCFLAIPTHPGETFKLACSGISLFLSAYAFSQGMRQ